MLRWLDGLHRKTLPIFPIQASWAWEVTSFEGT